MKIRKVLPILIIGLISAYAYQSHTVKKLHIPSSCGYERYGNSAAYNCW